MKEIYKKLQNKNITFKHVCEVGVYLPETSNIIDFIKSGVKATLVEADPVTADKIRTYFKDYKVQLFPVAVFDHTGKIKLSKASASTFVSELKSSPAITNDKYEVTEENSFEVDCMLFSDIDDGTIDLLSIDIEGCEWYVLKYMTSRPQIISVETHGKYYTNPFMKEISEWMYNNGYDIWYKDGSDTVYMREGIFSVSVSDKIGTAMSELSVGWKKIKGKIKGV
ncbi:MAG: FkbM family methyltransferase [Bacteroidota bacterium]